jgi:hypothetical protein
MPNKGMDGGMVDLLNIEVVTLTLTTNGGMGELQVAAGRRKGGGQSTLVL